MENETIAELYVVSTPIGNLEDISWRARQTLASVDLIAAEDTRHSAKLLGLLDIKGKKLISYYDEIEERRSLELIRLMKDENKSIALISDAGTPCICDPGYRLVAAARAAGIRVVPIPGVCAISTLLAACGLPAHRFLFVGFLPSKMDALKNELRSWSQHDVPVICYESPHRVLKTLTQLAEIFPDCHVAVGRELTKIHEEIVSFSMAQALTWAKEHIALKGEFVLMVSPSKPKREKREIVTQIESELNDLLAASEDSGRRPSHKDLLQHFSLHGLNRKDLYKLLLEKSKTDIKKN